MWMGRRRKERRHGDYFHFCIIILNIKLNYDAVELKYKMVHLINGSMEDAAPSHSKS